MKVFMERFGIVVILGVVILGVLAITKFSGADGGTTMTNLVDRFFDFCARLTP